MRKEASLPVRLDVDLSRRLERAATHLGLTKSALIRILIQSFVDQLEASGGKIVMPPQWKTQGYGQGPVTLRRVADGRSEYPAVKKRAGKGSRETGNGGKRETKRHT